LKDEADLKLAKVDATVEKEVSNKFGIKGFPTLIFFKNGNQQDYKGGRTKDAIVDYLRKKAGPTLVELKTAADVDAFKTKNVVGVVYFGDIASEEGQAFKAVSEEVDSVFGYSSDAAAAEANGAKDSAVLFK